MMTFNKKTKRENASTRSLLDIVKSVRQKWAFDIHKRQALNINETFMLPDEVSDESQETILLTDAVEWTDDDLDETTAVLTKSSDFKASNTYQADTIRERIIENTAANARLGAQDSPHLETDSRKDIEETILLSRKSSSSTSLEECEKEQLRETFIQPIAANLEETENEPSNFPDLDERIEETVVLSGNFEPEPLSKELDQQVIPDTIIQHTPTNFEETKKASSNFLDLQDEGIEETVLLSGNFKPEPLPGEIDAEVLPDTIIQQTPTNFEGTKKTPLERDLTKYNAVEETVVFRDVDSNVINGRNPYLQTDHRQELEEPSDLSQKKSRQNHDEEKKQYTKEVPTSFEELEEPSDLSQKKSRQNHDEEKKQYTKEVPTSFESLVRHLAAEIQEICTPNQPNAEMIIERYLDERLQGYTPKQKVRVLDALMNRSYHSQQATLKSYEANSERFSELLSLLLGEKLSGIDISSPEIIERLAESINTVLDTLNQLMKVIDFTLLGQEGELETIRHYIGASIDGRETRANSLEEYLSQIKQAFLISHQAFYQATEKKLSEIIDELNPDRISAAAKKRLHWGPFQKAECFETYTEKYRTVEKWFASDRFKKDLLAEFEKNCRILFLRKGGRSEKNH